MALNETPSGRPYWPIALALVVGVAVLVTAGVVLSGRFRTPVGVQPAPSIPIATSPIAQAQGNTLVASQQLSSPAASSAAGAQQQIEAAYLRYWQVYSDAVLNLDPSHLNEVLAGRALQLVTDEINGLKAQDKPAKIDVQHSYAIVRFDQTSATLVDDYLSRSVLVDPSTKQPLPRSDPPTRVRQSFEFQKADGNWKILDGTRQTLPSSR